MPEFSVRSDSVNVEQIMEQIRARIREKRGVDYTEEQIRELATVKLERFLDPKGVRSDLLEQFRRAQPPYFPPELPNYAFEDGTLFASHRAPLRWIRRLLRPLLKLFFNPNPLIQALNIQSRLNTMQAEREARREASRHGIEQLQYEVLHNLVVETTRASIELKNLKMRVESLASRLEFNERRARALESVVAYKPEADATPEREPSRREIPERATAERPTVAAPQGPEGSGAQDAEGPGQRSRRRRRRRGRRGGVPAVTVMDAGGTSDATTEEPHRPEAERTAPTGQPDHRGASGEIDGLPRDERTSGSPPQGEQILHDQSSPDESDPDQQ